MDAITRSLQVSLLYIFVFLSGVHTQPKCFLNQPDPSHKHHLYYNGNSLPIILEGSYHLTQNITNHLLQILLTEVIGYEWVEIQYQYDQSMNASAILERMSGCTISGCGDGSKAMIPRTMVNIEVPVITGFDEMKWTSTGHIADAGNVGIQGRLGWFMPTYIINSFWKNGIIADHWRFLLLEAATNFSMLDQLHLIRNLTMNKSNSNKHFCDTDYCLHGIFYGPGCTQSDNDTCAILLSSYPEIDQGALKSQVEYLKLPIKIAWIGHHLHNFVFNAIKKLQPVLFFARYPDIVTLPNYFTRITFPECIAPLQNFPSDCDFQDNQFKKYVWSRIKTNSPEAYHLISHLNFDSIVYSAFLSSYVIRKSAFRVACDWLIHNEAIWKKWIPENLSTKSTIHLLGLFPLTGHQWRQPGLVQGAELAAELINKDETILPDYNLNIIEVDSKCKPDIAMKEFIRYIRNYTSMSIAGVLGPACSDEAEPIAALSRHFHMVTISYGAEASSLSDRMNYPYFYRTIPQVDHHKYVYEKFLDAMGWYHVGAIAEAGQELPEYHLSLQDYLQHHGISVVVKRNIKYGPKNTLDVSQLFADLRAQNVRVIIADFYDRAARAIMCEAYRQRMTAHEGYIWFLPSWYSPDWWDVGFHNNQINYGSDEPKEDVPCTTKNMAYAVNGHFVLSKTFSDSYKTLVAGDITVGRYKELYAEKVGKAEINGSPYANYVYDAVWTYAFALNKLVNSVPGAMETLHTKSTTDAFIKLINKTDFPGVTGRVRFEGSDRPGSLNILQFLHNGSRIVGKYTPGKKLGKGELEIYKSAITWMTSDGRKPTDGYLEPSQCVIENFRTLFGTTCEMAIVIANVIGFGIFVIFFVFVMVFIKFRYDAKVRVQHNRMKELGLSPSEFSQCFSLDDWEILRDNVVLNRKLGEGAFGTVYGGEVFMGEERWVAVAVKTLKIGSRFEEKIDFLSEAEIMKRFNHPNIVQLLGVCTRGEPVYAIMQYHLHGDLKTYLLSRRNLVGSDTKEAEDVSPRRLTQMALDISSGLKYIHDLKYVHRDVACRNCLVHSSQTVKIGDFGMTRPIIESDYYRFTKKGMLPVRWMSPESLWDGLFTTKSDVWSFGVLIYEIVTFGSFPYQGLSNNQVMEYVKSGSRFILPGNCSEDLCTFIYSCLAYEPNDRPDMEDIIDQLMKSPEFLIPCLDAPTTSVVIEDSDSLDIMSASCQNTITKSSNCTTLLNRLSQTSQDIKRFSGGSQGGGKSSTPTKLSIKTFVPALLSRPRSNSLGTTTPQSSQRESRYDQFYEIQDESPNFSFSIDKSKRHSDEIPGNASFMRCIPLLSPSEKGDATSDYFSDNSKELCQNLTFEMCQTVTSL